LHARSSPLPSGAWQASLDFDFLINLSDADIALRTNAEILAWLRPFRATSYSMIQVHGGEGELIERTLKFAREHPVVECGGYGLAAVRGKVFDITPTPYCCFGRSGPVIYPTVNLTIPSPPEGGAFASGSQWGILHRLLCEYIVRDETARQWVKVFERRVLPDEMFLQTLAMSSPYSETVVKHNLRWIDWPHYHGDPGEYWTSVGWNFVGGPRVLRLADADAVFRSPFIFARKVDPEGARTRPPAPGPRAARPLLARGCRSTRAQGRRCPALYSRDLRPVLTTRNGAVLSRLAPCADHARVRSPRAHGRSRFGDPAHVGRVDPPQAQRRADPIPAADRRGHWQA
jgi:hypothetical protein